MTIFGIHRDKIYYKSKGVQSFSDRWASLSVSRGYTPKLLDWKEPKFFAEVESCNGFMWRFGFKADELRVAKRILPAIEQGAGIPVFPDHQTAWHFEDKISQVYLLTASHLPKPETKVLWTRDEAEAHCRSASYPFVIKLSSGIQSQNVALVKNPRETISLIAKLFGMGVQTLHERTSIVERALGGFYLPVKLALGGKLPPGLQGGYMLAQEYLPGNEFDTRVTVIGSKAFAFRRMNRPGDFRASGSGLIDWNPAEIDPRALDLAFVAARRLNAQSVAFDILMKEGMPVILEISFTYAAWAVAECPGHWVRGANEPPGSLSWTHGRMRPEDAIFDDFEQRVLARS